MSKKNNSKSKVKAICFTAVMSAVIFVFTYLFKVPIAIGYVHLGDIIIFLSVILLGRRRAAFAGAVGGALADLLSGYTQFILPTFVIKFAMAYICGIFVEKIIKNNTVGFIIGALLGGALQVIGYTLVSVALYSKESAIAAIPENIVQTAVGIIGALALIVLFDKTKITNKLQKMSDI